MASVPPTTMSTSVSPSSSLPHRPTAGSPTSGYPSAPPINPAFAAHVPQVYAPSSERARGSVSALSGSGVSSTSQARPSPTERARPDISPSTSAAAGPSSQYRIEPTAMGYEVVERVGGSSDEIRQEARAGSSANRARSSSSSHRQTAAQTSRTGQSPASATSTLAMAPPPPPPSRQTATPGQPKQASSSNSTARRPDAPSSSPPASSSRSRPQPSTSNATPSSSSFTIPPPKVFDSTPAGAADDLPMRSPSPSPQRPETSNVLVPDTSDDIDAKGEIEEDDDDEDWSDDVEPAGVPTDKDMDALEAKVREVTLDFGLGAEDEVGDDESTEMKGLREMTSMIVPLVPALRTIPSLHAQVQSQSKTIASLRKAHKIQAELAQRGAEELRSIKDVERGGWEASLRVILAKVHEAHKADLAAQKAKLESTHTKTWPSGPTTSRKETGFETIEAVDNAEYDKLIKKWMDVQADNRKLGMRETSMKMKIRDQESLVNALTEELHFLRASALHGLREAPVASPSHPNRALPVNRPIEDPLPPPAQRQTLGDARSEHLLLAAKRLRSLRITNPDIGLIRTRDYGQAGMVVPDEARALEDLLNGRRVGAPPTGQVASGSGGAGAAAAPAVQADYRGMDVSEEDEMTPKKRVRAKPKKQLSISTHAVPLAANAASIPIPRTPTAADKGKRRAGGPPEAVEMTPGGTVVPSSFDDLLMAAGVYSRHPPQIGVSATRGGASGEGEDDDDVDQIESDSDSPALGDSPKRRRMTSGAAWMAGQPLTSGNLNRQSEHPGGPLSANAPPPKTPLNTSTGSGKGEMHSSALNLLALASFGSPVRPTDSTPSSVRPDGYQQPHAGGLEPAFQLHSSPMLQHSSPIPSGGQSPAPPPFCPPPANGAPHPFQQPYTPLRPHHQHHQQQQQPLAIEDLFSPASSVVDRVKYQDPLRPSPPPPLSSDGPSTPSSQPFVNMSSANGQIGTTGAAGADPATLANMPAKRVRSPYLKWSNDEDELLARGVARYGQKWDLVSKAVPTRSYHQCRQRWLRKLGAFDHKPQIDSSPSGPSSSSAFVMSSPKKQSSATPSATAAASIFGGHGPETE